MKPITKWINTVDSHTEGEGTRLVLSGLPTILGATMGEKMAYVEHNLAWLPGFLLCEPRGHRDLYGAVLTPPSDPQADFGVIFMDNRKYEPMCGHGVIGVVTSLIELGMCPARPPETIVTLDTPAGLVRACAHVRDGHVDDVSFEGVPAFVFSEDIQLDIPGLGNICVNLSFGGNFFALVEVEQIGLDLIPANAARLARVGMIILEAVNQQVQVRHPVLPYIDRVIDLRFYQTLPGRPLRSRNCVILGDHMVDRSPCGTGSCAEYALRYARGELKLGDSLVSESIIGTHFFVQGVSKTILGSGENCYPAVTVRITGRAFLTGMSQFFLQCGDPFPDGFLLQ